MTANPGEIAAGIIFISAICATPVFSVLAYREWFRRTRYELPSWRNLLGAVSIGCTFLGWLGYSCLMAISFMRYQLPDALFGVILFGIIPVLALVGACSSFAWKGKARHWAITAASLMMAVCVWFFISSASLRA